MSTGFYEALKIERIMCPPDCSACQQVCVEQRGMLGIKSVHSARLNVHRVITCNQCAEPECRDVCPSGAITKHDKDGVVRIQQEKCVGCGLCSLACPYGAIEFDHNRQKAFKCDLCDGEPKCVKACSHKVLSFFRTDILKRYLYGKEDLVSPGTPLCIGCSAELLLRVTLKVLGRDMILVFVPGCMNPVMGAGPMKGCVVPSMTSLFPGGAAVMEGIKKYYRHVGRDVRVVTLAGDGATSDIGFQVLSGVAERGENIFYICYDNEAYMNTGIQRSSSTPYRAWTSSTPVGKTRKGKEQQSKYMPLIMALHGIPYVATASIGYLEDYVQKLVTASQVKTGMVYIHVFSPCPTGWRAPAESSIQLARTAVDTNYFPLWECKNGKFRFTYEVENPQPIYDFTKLMGRFKHLDKQDLEKLQEAVNARYELINLLTQRK